MQQPFLYVKNISWYTVVLVWQCVGMPNDNFFCFSYNNYIQKNTGGQKNETCRCRFYAYKRTNEKEGIDNVPIGYFERSTEIDDCDDAIE